MKQSIVLTVLVQTGFLHQIDNSKPIGDIGEHVLHTEVIPLRVPPGVEIWSKDKFVFELTSKDTQRLERKPWKFSSLLTHVSLAANSRLRSATRKSTADTFAHCRKLSLAVAVEIYPCRR